MDETPSAAPALTDEQIDNMAATFSDAYLRTLPPFGHPVGKDLFHRWLAAVIARAKREERGMIAHLIDGEMDVLTEDGQPLSSDEAAEYDALSRVRGYMQELTR